jgi:hypothetical protein
MLVVVVVRNQEPTLDDDFHPQALVQELKLVSQVVQLEVEVVVMVAQHWLPALSSSFCQMASLGLLQVRAQEREEHVQQARDPVTGFEDSLLNQLLDSAATST